MQNEYFEQLNNAYKPSFKAIEELGAINTKALQNLAELQLNFAALNIECVTEQAKLLTSTGNYKDLLSAESDFANDYSNKAMAIARQVAVILTESRNEVVVWCEKGIETAGKSATTSAKRISKKAKSSN